MRLLKFNNIKMDIDDNTAIGIDYQCYDIKEPGKRKINISNTFTLPKTANNMNVLGYPGNPHNLSTTVYDEILCDYWIDNEQFLKSAKVRVEEVTDRINCFVFEKQDIWDQLKNMKWMEDPAVSSPLDENGDPVWEYFTAQFFTWLVARGLPDVYAPWMRPATGGVFDHGILEDWINFLQSYEGWHLDGSTLVWDTPDVLFPCYFGNLYNYINTDIQPTELETNVKLWNNYQNGDNTINVNGGHFSIYAKLIFEFLEDHFEVDFDTAGVDIYSLFNDVNAVKLFTPWRPLVVKALVNFGVIYGWYFELAPASTMAPVNAVDKKGKSLYDFVIAFIQLFHGIIEETTDNNFVIRRFDDLINHAEVIDWSKRFVKVNSFKPKIDGFAQNNWIKASSVYEDGNESIGAANIRCFNKGLDENVDLFSIESHIPQFIYVTEGTTPDLIPDLSTSKAFETWEFLYNSQTLHSWNEVYGMWEGLSIPQNENIGGYIWVNAFYLIIPLIYSQASEYSAFEAIMHYPRFYEIEKWLTMADMKDFQYFRLFWIKQLNGSFFINKISGFNPGKSLQPTKIEIFKISDRTPALVDTDIEYWTDGIGEVFSDGNGEEFYTF